MPEQLLAPEGLPARVEEFTHAGCTLVSESFGAEAPTYLLLHGIGMGRSVFAGLARELGGRVIGIDLPGFGEAPEPPRTPTMERLADLVAAYLRHSGEKPVVAIGHSMGSQVAAELAARHPALVESLVLAGPTVDSAARNAGVQALRLLRDLWGEHPLVLWRGAREYLRGGPNLIRKMRATIVHEPEKAYARVSCPTLVLRGEGDPLAPESWCREILALIPDSELQEVPDHGHGTLISDAGPIAALLRAR